MKKLIACAAVLACLAPARADGPKPLPAQVKADRIQSIRLSQEGDRFLRSGAPEAAENDYRLAMKLWPFNPLPYPGLAEALKSEGKPEEAIHVYRALFYNSRSASTAAQDPLHLMNFALLLNETGHWQEAVSIYEKGLPDSADAEVLKAAGRFDPSLPMPDQMEALAHVARGIEYGRYGDSGDAMSEYERAMVRTPDLSVVNYYYGWGWQRLSPDERSRYGTEQQAKVALLKAVRIGKGDVKKAAQKALMVAMNPSLPAKATAK